MESHEQRYLKAPTVYHFTPDAAHWSCSFGSGIEIGHAPQKSRNFREWR